MEVKPTDVIPPEILTNSPQSKDYLHSKKIPIDIIVSDAESGVFSQTIKFDDKIVNDGDSIDLFYEKLGDHSISVSATDFVGNSASSTIKFRIIATKESTISDIERAYSLGWIDNQGIKNSLIKKLESKNTQKTGFVNELNAQRGKHINEQAFQILLEDIEWVLGI